MRTRTDHIVVRIVKEQLRYCDFLLSLNNFDLIPDVLDPKRLQLTLDFRHVVALKREVIALGVYIRGPLYRLTLD